jgi:DNA-directed RNA polymerase specialized sigma24 family protein
MYDPHRQVSAVDRMWVASLQARHGDLIARYVHRRTESPQDAQRVLEAVFRAAVEERDTIPAHALPWLIANARRHCAQTLRRGPVSRQAAIAPVIPLRSPSAAFADEAETHGTNVAVG